MTRYPKAVIDEWVEFSISGSTKIQVEEGLISYLKTYPSASSSEIVIAPVWNGRTKPVYRTIGQRKIQEGE